MQKIKDVKVLVLEDDLETVEVILKVLRNLEGDIYTFGVTVIPDYVQVEELINKNPHVKFDILLLDRDCHLGGSFHVLNLNNFDLSKAISISSVAEANDKAFSMGIKRLVCKDYSNLEDFSKRLKQEIIKIIFP